MKQLLTLCAITSCLLAVSACEPLPPEAYEMKDTPERLLTQASDIVTIDLTGKNYSDRLTDALIQNPPARAILNCVSKDAACKKARKILDKNKVITESTDSGTNVALVYERIAVRDCENRYVDNSINHYELNHPAFGCSITGNIAQMVTDKHQFTNPNLVDYYDGEKAATVYENYITPPAASSSSDSGSGTKSLLPSSSGGQ